MRYDMLRILNREWVHHLIHFSVSTRMRQSKVSCRLPGPRRLGLHAVFFVYVTMAWPERQFASLVRRCDNEGGES